ncbi:MAG TPA: hypothetical protein VIN59_06960 [Alphaproteobacteria bacterium]
MYKLLKMAGFTGVGLGVSFAIGGIICAAIGYDPEPFAPYLASVIIGSVIVFGGCLILALNEIARKVEAYKKS